MSLSTFTAGLSCDTDGRFVHSYLFLLCHFYLPYCVDGACCGTYVQKCKCSLLLLLVITVYLKDHCGKSTHDQARGLGKAVLTLTVPVQSLSIPSLRQ